MITWKKRDFITLIWIVLSASFFAFSINTFIYSGNFYPAGISGISVLLVRLSKDYLNITIPYGLLYTLLNIPGTYLVFSRVGKKFTIFSIIHYLLVSFLTLVFPNIYLNYDVMLLSIFGGLINGFAAWMALNRNASGGGTDFIAIYLSDKLKRPVWTWVMMANAILILIAGSIYGLEAALYSIIFQFVATQIINERYTRYKSKSLYMITTMPEEVSEAILKSTHHGITKIWGEGAYTKQKRCLLFMVVQEYQVNQVVYTAQKIDPHIFISVSNTERIIGNYHQTPLE